ncbi:S9 family peptidase [Cyclobacteriaceae bacterium]|nr:S9 family peptidase [Cyclobacteriaceae bacterium]
MKLVLALFFLSSFLNLLSQTDLKDIWVTYDFYPKYISDIKWYSDDIHLEIVDNQLVGHHVLPNETFDTILSSQEINNAALYFLKNIKSDNFDVKNYTLSPNKQYLLLEINEESIYRYSSKSHLLLVDLQNMKFHIPSKQKVLYPKFSPNNKYLSYIDQNNNIKVFDLSNNSIVSITKDGKKNKIINGKSDWVYEEEFELTDAYRWSGNNLFYLQFDESQVPEFTLKKQLSKGKLSYKYPKVGQPISTIKLNVFDISSGHTKTLYTAPDNTYLPQISVHNESVYITCLNRKQDDLTIYNFEKDNDWKKSKLYHETSSSYIELPEPLIFKSKTIYFTSEKNGYKHLYKLENGTKTQITAGRWEIDELYTSPNDLIYYSCNQDSKYNRVIKSYNTTTKESETVISTEGINSIEVSPTGKYLFVSNNSRYTPPKYSFLNPSNNYSRFIEKNTRITSKLDTFLFPEIYEGRFSVNEDSTQLSYHLILPPNFDSTKQYPVLTYVYGGPGYQLLKNSYDPFNFFWHSMLSQNDVIVAMIDPRGSGGQGKDFKSSTYQQLGIQETNDVINFATYLGNLSFINKDKLAIWGWSYGGYLSSKSFTESDVFALAIAVAPVGDWLLYDCAYTERYMGINKANYDQSSVTYTTPKSKGHLLLIHGTLDDNVHIQNSYLIEEYLTENNISISTHYFKDKNHGIYGGLTRYQLYTEMTEAIYKYLK